MDNRAYSSLVIKSVDDEKRIITGMASTPEVDRQGDSVNPMGAKFAAELPLLWMHRHDAPVGTVRFGKPTKAGIPFTATLPIVLEPSQLKARIDEAWSSVKSKIVKYVSIGFRPLKYSIIEATGGYDFEETEIFELSLCTVAANSGATINSFKSMDHKIRLAALGKEADELTTDNPSGVTEKSTPTKRHKLTPKEGTMKTIAEQLKEYQAELLSIDSQLDEIVTKSATDGETPDAADEEKEGELEQKRAAVVKHIQRLEKAQARAASTATPVVEKAGQGSESASDIRQGVRVKAPEKLEKGIEFTRYAMCQLAAKGNLGMAAQIAKTHYGPDARISKTLDYQATGRSLEGVMKAVVEAGTTLDATWAAPLVDYQNYAGDFVDFLRPQTIVGKFGTGNVPSLRRIPFNVRIPAQTSGGAAYWVGEGAPKPLTAFDFTATELRWAKIAAISVLTEELIRFSDPSAERLVRDALAGAVIERMDIDFINPAKAAVTNVSPASITNGITPIASSGSDAEAIRCDLQALWAPFIAARNAPRDAVYIMDSSTALALSLMMNALGNAEFPGISMTGGTLNGIPVIVSDYLPVDTGGGMVVLANASDIYFADDGQVTIDASREASLQMLDNPTNNSATGTPTTMVSMFQTNSVALRAERYVNWARRRVSAVAWLDGVNWGACS